MGKGRNLDRSDLARCRPTCFFSFSIPASLSKTWTRKPINCTTSKFNLVK